MQILFCAALDGVTCEEQSCPCGGWIRAAARPKKRKKGGKAKKSKPDAIAFVAPTQTAALLEALAAGEPIDGDERPGQWADYPVSAWATPDGVEIGFNTLCFSVRQALAAVDEPATIATADGGWRRAISLFTFADGLKTIPIRPRDKMPWRDFAELRDVCLDIISDRRQPILARLAEVAAIAAVVVDEQSLPAELPQLSPRVFLAWRGFLESRVASANAKKLRKFAETTAPLFAPDSGLTPANAETFGESLDGDWRHELMTRMCPHERLLADPIEAYFSARLFATPIQRDVSLSRAWAEMFEGLAVGLRYLAALTAATDSQATPAMTISALAMGEHYVVSAAQKLPSFSLPPPSHGPSPKMADLDMTLASIC